MTEVSWHPYIVEDDEYKVLQFADADIQSKMRKSAPDELVLSYTQAMMAFLLFIEAPRHVVVGGLGGGSLSKFCYRMLPDTRVTTVEISREVIDLRNEFCIPRDDERFQVVHADLAAWIRDQPAIADVILLDGYDQHGVCPSLDGADFYARCAAALVPGGMLVVNVNLGATADSSVVRRRVAALTDDVVVIRSAAGHNDIVLGFAGTAVPPVADLKVRARKLRAHTGIDFPLLLDKVRSAAGR